MISCWFFKGPYFALTFLSYYFLFSFCFVGCVLFSKIKLFLVWVCLAIFWCFIVSFGMAVYYFYSVEKMDSFHLGLLDFVGYH